MPLYKNLMFALLVLGLSRPAFPAKLQMSITVDDLPAHGPLAEFGSRVEIAQQILAALKKHSVPEVYGFLNGKLSDEHPGDTNVFEAWTKAGYPLGNHTYSHVNAAKVSPDEFASDWKKNETTLKRFSKNGDYHIFRFPYLSMGETWKKRQEILKKLKKGGYRIAEVTLDFSDWAWNNAYDRCLRKKDTKAVSELSEYYIKIANRELDWSIQASQKTFDRVIPMILLLHVGAFGAKNLDALLEAYEKRGVEFIPLTKAMKDPSYTSQVDVKRDEQGSFFDRHATLRDRSYDPENEDHLEFLTKICGS